MKLINIGKYNLILILFLTTNVFASGYMIINPTNVAINKSVFTENFITAKKLFEKEFDTRIENIVFSINPSDCLSTGYNIQQNRVVFCNSDKVINYGLNSLDVFNHELFHAFICNYEPELCNGAFTKYIHEGLADYFSYLLNPDLTFGEDFYKNRPYIRNYKTSWREGLIEGDHLKGNILVTQMIKQKLSLLEATNLFERVEKPSEVHYSVTGLKYSRLNKYRLKLNEEVLISFSFATNSKVARIAWSPNEHLQLASNSKTKVSLRITESIPNTHFDIFFYSEEGYELGFKRFYIGNTID